MIAVALVMSPLVARAQDDTDLAQYHDRFKQGLDRYEANDVAGALSFWEPLYRDLGPSRGYRVGYNLARAYEVFGDATRAAERYAAFLEEVKSRQKDGKTIDDVVATDELKATARLEELGRTRARLHIVAATPPESVRIDKSESRLGGFTAYVAPGPHDIVFSPGSAHEHTEHVDAHAGQVVEVAPPATETPHVVKVEPPVYRTATKHPFGPGWLLVAGATTLAVGGGLTATAYANATVLFNRSQPAPTTKEISDYNGARTLAYVSWVAPATLAIVTVALIAWYAAGTKHIKLPITTGFVF